MHLIKHELMARGYVAGYEQDQRREAALNTALVLQRHAFTHFVTVTFPDAITELEAVIAINRSLRSLGRLNQKRVRFFCELSLAPQHGFTSATESSSGDAEMVTRWHVHLLLGGLNGEITCRQIASAFHHASGGIVDVQVTDGSPRLSEYLASRNTGNRVGKLQRTNDRTIKTTMARFGEVI